MMHTSYFRSGCPEFDINVGTTCDPNTVTMGVQLQPMSSTTQKTRQMTAAEEVYYCKHITVSY